ncbi:XRE family transcriptional regulator [Streptomyces sp. NPDC057621]|uniref:XRE family transcriptional regulator n=1 Tax=Streptomyces sp. NPDC057621 TaxID=3346186 RepID=UPI0036AD8843
MGRHEHELTARAVEMAEVAQQLRLMRRLSGLTYARLAQITGLSVTQLHRAANGWRTPWPVVEKFAVGCGAAPTTIRQQWQEAMSAPEAASFGIDRVQSITTLDELREAMQELLNASGLSLRQLSLCAPAGALPRTTLNDALRGHARLSEGLVTAFVQALRLGAVQESAWAEAWQRAVLNKSVQRQDFKLAPSPHLLRVLADIDMPEWNCLAALVDHALEEQGQVRDSPAGPVLPLDVSISFRENTGPDGGSIVVRDQGAGMNQSELLESVFTNWARSGPSLAGVGLNIALHRLGSVITVRTARREDPTWSVLTLDLRTLVSHKEWKVPLHHEPKQRKDEHGTEITVGELRWPARDLQRSRLHDRLGDIYSHLIREDRLRLTLDQHPVAPKLPCAWDATRQVQLREGPVAARQDIDVTLATVQWCQDCGESTSLEADSCAQCSSRRLVPLPHRVRGWLGIQRYLHPTDYGIDFYRNGRKIRSRDKSLFTWTDDDTGEELAEYPAEIPHRGGRIIGEIHCDHVPVLWSRDSFTTDSQSWRSVVRVIRGQGPLSSHHGQRRGYPANTSPLAVLYRAFCRSDPGLRYLIPGDGTRALHKRAREWGAAFHRGEHAFQSDQAWYDAAAAHDAQRLLRPAPSSRTDSGQQELQLKQALGASSAPGPGHAPGAPQAVMRCEYLFDREARTSKHGGTHYRTTHQRLRVSNIGTGPADRLRIFIEPVGEGTAPLVLNVRGDDSALEVDRLLGRTHTDFPIARTWATASQAQLTLRWEEGGDSFTEIQSVTWS